MSASKLFVVLLLFFLLSQTFSARHGRRRISRERCPRVKALRNFNINDMMGFWYVVQYYASSEEIPEYACMRSRFSLNDDDMQITMKFSYLFTDDPFRDQLFGNITWFIPNMHTPAHWMHTEYIYEGIYNTYVIDTDYKSWTLLMHCAEKTKSPKYLSALLLSRKPELPVNAINFLREKLPRYDIDTSFMFNIDQKNCDRNNMTLPDLKYSID